jgi:hypothetical protein
VVRVARGWGMTEPAVARGRGSMWAGGVSGVACRRSAGEHEGSGALSVIRSTNVLVTKWIHNLI